MLCLKDLNNDIIYYITKFICDIEIFCLLTISKETYKIFKSLYPDRMIRIFYIQYLFRYDRKKLLNYYYKLPYEIFEEHNINIDYYDSIEYKDYSSGYRRICSERYYTHSEEKEELRINYENFKTYIELIKENKYKEYKKSGKFIKKISIKKEDLYDEKLVDKTIYYLYNKLSE